MMYPIKVMLSSGSVVHVSASREDIESYGNVNELVNKMIKPLQDVHRIEVEMYCEELEDKMIEVTYYHDLERWVGVNERMVLTYQFEGIIEEDRGTIGRQDDWLPKYTITNKKGRGVFVNTVLTADIVAIMTRKDHLKQYDLLRHKSMVVNDMTVYEALQLQEVGLYHSIPYESKAAKVHGGKRMRRQVQNTENIESIAWSILK